MVSKTKDKKPAKKAKKTQQEKSQKEDKSSHGPDVKRLLEQYEDKDESLGDEDFASSEQFDMDPKEEGEF